MSHTGGRSAAAQRGVRLHRWRASSKRTLAPRDAQQKRVRRRGWRRARGARVAPSTRPRWARRERRERPLRKPLTGWRKPRARHHSAARPSRRQPRQRSRSRQACRRNASGAGRAGACAVYRQRRGKQARIGVMRGETSHARIVAGSSPVRFSIVRAPPDRVTSGRAPPQLVCAPPSCAGRLATCACRARACRCGRVRRRCAPSTAPRDRKGARRAARLPCLPVGTARAHPACSLPPRKQLPRGSAPALFACVLRAASRVPGCRSRRLVRY